MADLGRWANEMKRQLTILVGVFLVLIALFWSAFQQQRIADLESQVAHLRTRLMKTENDAILLEQRIDQKFKANEKAAAEERIRHQLNLEPDRVPTPQ